MKGYLEKTARKKKDSEFTGEWEGRISERQNGESIAKRDVEPRGFLEYVMKRTT